MDKYHLIMKSEDQTTWQEFEAKTVENAIEVAKSTVTGVNTVLPVSKALLAKDSAALNIDVKALLLEVEKKQIEEKNAGVGSNIVG